MFRRKPTETSAPPPDADDVVVVVDRAVNPYLVLFHEPATAGRIASLGLIVAGIVGLKLATPA